MKQSNVPAKSSGFNMKERPYPDEYIKKAKALVEKRHSEEERLRSQLPESAGRDDRLSRTLFEMDCQLRKDLSVLRKEYGIT